jgi:TonB family protein
MRVSALSARRRGSFVAAAALIALLPASSTTVVGITPDAPPARLNDAESPQGGAPLTGSAVRAAQRAVKSAGHLAEALTPPAREQPLAELSDNDGVDEVDDVTAVDALSEEEAVLALERELSLQVGKEMREEDYPEEAQRWRWTGTAMIDVIVGANGSVRDVSLGKTSGFRILDAQALIVVRRVSKLFVPVQLRGRDIAVTIPIGFYLQDM